MLKGARKKRSTKTYRVVNKSVIFSALSLMSAFSLFMGMSIFLVKSPDQKTALYTSLIEQHQQEIETNFLSADIQTDTQRKIYGLILAALQENPNNGQMWKIFSDQLLQMNQIDKATKSRDIAIMLGIKDVQSTAMIPKSFIQERNIAFSGIMVSPTTSR